LNEKLLWNENSWTDEDSLESSDEKTASEEVEMEVMQGPQYPPSAGLG